MELGIVSFFNKERGFGRIKTGNFPEGVFVHFSDVQGEAKILVENEMVRFEVDHTDKGLRARTVVRLTERLRGRISQFSKGFGYVRASDSQQQYFLHHSDILATGFRRVSHDFEVEFSPFETERGLQAKEVIVTDMRPALEKFAHLGDTAAQLEHLISLVQPEMWSPSNLKNYLIHVFRRIEEEGKIAFGKDNRGADYACFHTGLVTRTYEEIFAYFTPNRKRYHPAGYLQQPRWALKAFAPESDYLMSYFPERPEMACFYTDPAELIFDPARRLVPDYDHIVGERESRFPEKFRSWGREELLNRLRNAIHLAERRVRRNYRTAVPQYYDGAIQLLLPLCLESPDHADMALVVAREHEIYRAQTVLPLSWAYQNARLIAPPEALWLTEQRIPGLAGPEGVRM